MRPQGAQRTRLGPLPARGAKPHSFHPKTIALSAAIGKARLGKMHPQERQHRGGAAGRGTECSPETGLKGITVTVHLTPSAAGERSSL